ncbi:hypothetical protein HK104_006050 [Borealophlyctis nickersoniae]|nr:hypothetical protein HK104_006050 [Borealophlyctis nickersoniae]
MSPSAQYDIAERIIDFAVVGCEPRNQFNLIFSLGGVCASWRLAASKLRNDKTGHESLRHLDGMIDGTATHLRWIVFSVANSVASVCELEGARGCLFPWDRLVWSEAWDEIYIFLSSVALATAQSGRRLKYLVNIMQKGDALKSPYLRKRLADAFQIAVKKATMEDFTDDLLAKVVRMGRQDMIKQLQHYGKYSDVDVERVAEATRDADIKRAAVSPLPTTLQINRDNWLKLHERVEHRDILWTRISEPVFAKLGQDLPDGYQLGILQQHFKQYLVVMRPTRENFGRGMSFTVPVERREEFLKALEAYVTSPEWAAVV